MGFLGTWQFFRSIQKIGQRPHIEAGRLLGNSFNHSGKLIPRSRGLTDRPTERADRRPLISKTKKEKLSREPLFRNSNSESFLKIMNICCNIPGQITDGPRNPRRGNHFSLSNKTFWAIDPHRHTHSALTLSLGPCSMDHTQIAAHGA